MTKRTDCKRYEVLPNVGVEDNLTGKIMTTYREFAKELNHLSDRNDKLVEELYDSKGEK